MIAAPKRAKSRTQSGCATGGTLQTRDAAHTPAATIRPLTIEAAM